MTMIDLFLSIYDILLHDHEFRFSVKANSGAFYFCQTQVTDFAFELVAVVAATWKKYKV
jgi:hypothetical protein